MDCEEARSTLGNAMCIRPGQFEKSRLVGWETFKLHVIEAQSPWASVETIWRWKAYSVPGPAHIRSRHRGLLRAATQAKPDHSLRRMGVRVPAGRRDMKQCWIYEFSTPRVIISILPSFTRNAVLIDMIWQADSTYRPLALQPHPPRPACRDWRSKIELRKRIRPLLDVDPNAVLARRC